MGPAGFYIGLRIRYAFPSLEVNALPEAWLNHYAREKLFFTDPAIKWSYDHTGATRWSALEDDDPMRMVPGSRSYGLTYGAVAAFNETIGLRSYGIFFREDREYDDAELDLLADHIAGLHREFAPPTTLTRAEIEVLRRIKGGGKLKEIAWQLGVTESAIKQRLRNARDKLGASNATHAATLASQFGLI